MRNSKVTYQLLVISILLVLMVVGLYIGIQASKPKEKSLTKDDTEPANTTNVILYSEKDQKNKLQDIEVVYVEVYKECGHIIQNKSIEYGSIFSDVDVKESKAAIDKGYKKTKNSDGILMFEKELPGKCSDHYLIKLEGGRVVVYNIKADGKYGKFKDTDIYQTSLREMYIISLNKEMKVETLEELNTILEDMES